MISSGNYNILDNDKLKDSILRVITLKNYNCYSSPKGIYELREKISQYLFSLWNYFVNPSEMIITSGSQQSINLLSDILFNNDMRVLIEQPTYFGAIKVFEYKNIEMIGISISEDGIDLFELEKIIKETLIKVIYVVPTFNNPTGYAWSNDNRLEFLKIVNKYEIIVIEDDPYSLINFTDNKYYSLYQLNKGKNVIYLGTFSKVISPSINIGYILAEKSMIDKIYLYKEMYDLGTSLFNQYVILDYLNNNNLIIDMEIKISEYLNKLNFLFKKLSDIYGGKIEMTKPKGGLFFLVKCSCKDKIFNESFRCFIYDDGFNYFRINICAKEDSFLE